MGRLVEVLVHEIIHVLGFGSNHYDDWRGPDGKPYGRKNVIVSQGGRPYLATPKVTKVGVLIRECSLSVAAFCTFVVNPCTARQHKVLSWRAMPPG